MLAYYYGDKQFAKDTAEKTKMVALYLVEWYIRSWHVYGSIADGNYFEMVVTEDAVYYISRQFDWRYEIY